MSYLHLLDGELDPLHEIANQHLALFEAVDVVEIAGADGIPERVLPAAVRECIIDRRATFEMIRAGIGDRSADGWLRRDGETTATIGTAIGSGGDSGSCSSVFDAVANVSEDVAEREREEWGLWMLLTGAIIGSVSSQRSTVTPALIVDALSAASDALDHDAAMRRHPSTNG